MVPVAHASRSNDAVTPQVVFATCGASFQVTFLVMERSECCQTVPLQATCPDPPFPAFLRKKRGLAKKSVDKGEKSEENSKKARIALFLKGQKNKIPAFFAKKRGFYPKKQG